MDEACIVVLDDDENSLMVIEEMLSSMGIGAVTIQDPTRLEAVLQTLDSVCAIFVDLEMPKLNGYEILQFLRETMGSSVPIIACTVHTNEMSTARKLGFDGFIAKPLSAERFPDQLERVMSGGRVWDAY